MLDFNMTTIIDISELRVIVKGQLGKGRFWCSASIRIIAIREQSMMPDAIIPFHHWNTLLVGGGVIVVVGSVCAGSSLSLKFLTIFDVVTGFDLES